MLHLWHLVWTEGIGLYGEEVSSGVSVIVNVYVSAVCVSVCAEIIQRGIGNGHSPRWHPYLYS